MLAGRNETVLEIFPGSAKTFIADGSRITMIYVLKGRKKNEKSERERKGRCEVREKGEKGRIPPELSNGGKRFLTF